MTNESFIANTVTSWATKSPRLYMETLDTCSEVE